MSGPAPATSYVSTIYQDRVRGNEASESSSGREPWHSDAQALVHMASSPDNDASELSGRKYASAARAPANEPQQQHAYGFRMESDGHNGAVAAPVSNIVRRYFPSARTNASDAEVPSAGKTAAAGFLISLYYIYFFFFFMRREG